MRSEPLLVFGLSALLLGGCLGEMDPQPRAARWNSPPRRVPVGTVTVGAPPARPPIDLALLQRGQQRFGIYCWPCHGPLGDGRGEVVRRGFPSPPSFLDERLRQVSDEHFYSAISNGAGRMLPYADRIEPGDRWAIVAYIRALQLSRRAHLADLPDTVRREFK